MHGGLICIAFCLSVLTPGVLLKVTGIRVKGHVGQGQPNACDIGRWAHIDVKLLHD